MQKKTIIYNLSIFKYFQKKQMDLALKHIKQGETIKSTANKFS